MTTSQDARDTTIVAGSEPAADGCAVERPSGLVGTAVGPMRAAMKDEDWPLLRAYLKKLRARGLAEDELSRTYTTLRDRHHPSAPSLRDLARRSD